MDGWLGFLLPSKEEDINFCISLLSRSIGGFSIIIKCNQLVLKSLRISLQVGESVIRGAL